MNQRVFSKLCAAVFAVLLFASIATAQNRERFGISAKAGGVNAVSGHVMVKRQGQASQLLTAQDDLVSGDVVTTGSQSQAEILLNPGAYFRLAENSEFVMVDTSLDDMKVRLNRGSAIVEATGMDRVGLRIPIITDQQSMTILRAGIYRINAAPGMTEILVRQGLVQLGSDPTNLIKSGKKITITGNAASASIAKIIKTDKDDFDSWSKQRGASLAQANQRLSARTVNGYLSGTSNAWPYGFGRWGLWTWSARAGCYTFLPFFYGWGSPYGGYYGSYAWVDGWFGDGTCCGRGGYRQPTIVRETPSQTGGLPTYTGGGSSIGKGMDRAPESGPPPTRMDVAPPSSPPAVSPGPALERGGGVSKVKDPIND